MLEALLVGDVTVDGRMVKAKAAFAAAGTPALVVEPGRAIVSDSTVTLARVAFLKTVAGGHNLISLDLGVVNYGEALVALPARHWALASEHKRRDPQPFETFVAGNLCFAADMLSRTKVALQRQPVRGDIVLIPSTGAYNPTFFASNANSFPRPARVLLEETGAWSYLKQADTYDEIFSGRGRVARFNRNGSGNETAMTLRSPWRFRSVRPLRSALSITFTAVALLACAPTQRADGPVLHQPANVGEAKIAATSYYDSGAYERDITLVTAAASAWIAERAPQVDRPALVLDIDDTSLTNWQVIVADDFGRVFDGPCDNLPAGPCGWVAWDLRAATPPITQTLALFEHARALDVAVFFITGRDESQRAATEQNLAAVGYARLWRARHGTHRLPLRIGGRLQGAAAGEDRGGRVHHHRQYG